jgi:hypothetical protein
MCVTTDPIRMNTNTSVTKRESSQQAQDVTKEPTYKLQQHLEPASSDPCVVTIFTQAYKGPSVVCMPSMIINLPTTIKPGKRFEIHVLANKKSSKTFAVFQPDANNLKALCKVLGIAFRGYNFEDTIDIYIKSVLVPILPSYTDTCVAHIYKDISQRVTIDTFKRIHDGSVDVITFPDNHAMILQDTTTLDYDLSKQYVDQKGSSSHTIRTILTEFDHYDREITADDVATNPLAATFVRSMANRLFLPELVRDGIGLERKLCVCNALKYMLLLINKRAIPCYYIRLSNLYLPKELKKVIASLDDNVYGKRVVKSLYEQARTKYPYMLIDTRHTTPHLDYSYVDPTDPGNTITYDLSDSVYTHTDPASNLLAPDYKMIENAMSLDSKLLHATRKRSFFGVFINGPGGSGKTHLVASLLGNLANKPCIKPQRIQVLACSFTHLTTTSLHDKLTDASCDLIVASQTADSLRMKLKPIEIDNRQLFWDSGIRVLVIDEVSMLGDHHWEAIHELVLTQYKFTHVFLVGDFLQLQPIVSHMGDLAPFSTIFYDLCNGCMFTKKIVQQFSRFKDFNTIKMLKRLRETSRFPIVNNKAISPSQLDRLREASDTQISCITASNKQQRAYTDKSLRRACLSSTNSDALYYVNGKGPDASSWLSKRGVFKGGKYVKTIVNIERELSLLGRHRPHSIDHRQIVRVDDVYFRSKHPLLGNTANRTLLTTLANNVSNGSAYLRKLGNDFSTTYDPNKHNLDKFTYNDFVRHFSQDYIRVCKLATLMTIGDRDTYVAIDITTNKEVTILKRSTTKGVKAEHQSVTQQQIEASISHCSSLTVHKAQGSTIDGKVYIVNKTIFLNNKQWWYVAFSRARSVNDITLINIPYAVAKDNLRSPTAFKPRSFTKKNNYTMPTSAAYAMMLGNPLFD